MKNVVVGLVLAFGAAGIAYAAQCIACQGSGLQNTVCFQCKGSGHNGTQRCFQCKGKGFPPCFMCNGTGQSR